MTTDFIYPSYKKERLYLPFIYSVFFDSQQVQVSVELICTLHFYKKWTFSLEWINTQIN